ncbi:MAG: hypothetical protein LBS83_00980 [Holosporales bacterium]|nr:hypothetical protein [Holosporales bacterium]
MRKFANRILVVGIKGESFLNSVTVFTFNFSAFEGSAAQRPKIVKIN